MYSHLRPLPQYGYSGCIFSSLMPIHKNRFGELMSEQMHAAHVFAPRRIQEIFLTTYYVLVSCQGVSLVNDIDVGMT